MKALKIVDCHDCLMWYNKRVGQVVPFVREYPEDYMSLEPAGYTNIVHKYDAELIEIEEDFNGYY